MERPNVVFIDCHDLGDWLGCCAKFRLRQDWTMDTRERPFEPTRLSRLG